LVDRVSRLALLLHTKLEDAEGSLEPHIGETARIGRPSFSKGLVRVVEQARLEERFGLCEVDHGAPGFQRDNVVRGFDDGRPIFQVLREIDSQQMRTEVASVEFEDPIDRLEPLAVRTTSAVGLSEPEQVVGGVLGVLCNTTQDPDSSTRTVRHHERYTEQAIEVEGLAVCLADQLLQCGNRLGESPGSVMGPYLGDRRRNVSPISAPRPDRGDEQAGKKANPP